MRLDGLRLAAFLRLGRNPVATRLALRFLGNSLAWRAEEACLWQAWNKDGDGRRQGRELCLQSRLCLMCRLRHQQAPLRPLRQPNSQPQQEAQCLKDYQLKTLRQCQSPTATRRQLQGRGGWATPTLLAAPERASAGLIAIGNRDRAGLPLLRLRSAPDLSRLRL